MPVSNINTVLRRPSATVHEESLIPMLPFTAVVFVLCFRVVPVPTDILMAYAVMEKAGIQTKAHIVLLWCRWTGWPAFRA